MDLSEYAQFDGLGLASLVHERQVSAKEICECALAAIAKVNPILNCVIETFPERVAALDDRPPRDDALFGGVPTLLKDLYKFENGTLSEGGCLLTQGLRGWYDSEVVLRLRRAGLVILGRSAVPELGWSATCNTRIAGLTRNPWDPDTYPGGSSSGASAAVAAGVVPVAHASDGGGSTRSPAAYNGLVGLKPTRGRVSDGPGAADPNAGMSAHLAVTRTVRDTAAVLDALQGAAVGDPHQAPPPERSFLEEVGRAPRRLRIAWTTEAFDGGPVDDAIVDAVRDTAEVLRGLGHDVHEGGPEVDWEPYIQAVNDVWSAGIAYTCDAFGARVGRTPGPDNLMRTSWAAYEYGRDVTAQQYLAALDEFNTVRRSVGAFFEDLDAFMTPTTAALALPHAAHGQDQDFGALEWAAYMLRPECFLSLFNVTGQPAISLPLHETPDHAQIGVHFVARFGDEATLLRLASVLESEMPWSARRPPVHVAEVGRLRHPGAVRQEGE